MASRALRDAIPTGNAQFIGRRGLGYNFDARARMPTSEFGPIWTQKLRHAPGAGVALAACAGASGQAAGKTGIA